jgi:hypothetical protein
MWTHSISKFGLILQKYSDIMRNSVNFSVCSSRREGNLVVHSLANIIRCQVACLSIIP